MFPVHLAYTAVNDGPLHRLQAILAANDQLHQRQDKVGFQRHRVFLVKAQVNVHRIDVVGAVRGDLDDLSAQPLDKGRVFAHRVHHNDPVTGGKEHVHKLPLCGKGFTGTRHVKSNANLGYKPVSGHFSFQQFINSYERYFTKSKSLQILYLFF